MKIIKNIKQDNYVIEKNRVKLQPVKLKELFKYCKAIGLSLNVLEERLVEALNKDCNCLIFGDVYKEFIAMERIPNKE